MHMMGLSTRSLRFKLATFAILLLTVLAGSLTTAHASNIELKAVKPATVKPSITTNAWTEISNGRSDRCLDADLNTIGGNGTRVQLWDCNGQSQQQWLLTSQGGGYQIKNGHSGRCLDADLNTIGYDGGKVQLWDCNGSRQQTWIPSTFDDICNSSGTSCVLASNLYEPFSDRCLDADLNTINNNGTKVQIYGCITYMAIAEANQLWYQSVYA